MTMTITEGLAEVKTIGKRLEKKRQSVMNFLARQDMLRDPIEGGSDQMIVRERQAIHDLEERIVALRAAIRVAGSQTTIKVGDVERSMTDWITWRRDVAPGAKKFLTDLSSQINRLRNDAAGKKVNVVAAGATPSTPQDLIINVNEAQLAADIEKMEEILGALDGQLSLKNATTTIDV